MDIEAKRRQLRALIMDLANGFVMSEESLPPNILATRYIDFDKLIRNRVVFAELSQVLAWDAREIYKETPYDRIITTDERATIFAHEIGRLEEVAFDVIQAHRGHGSQAPSDARLMLEGCRCLIVTDLIVTGQIVSRTIMYLRELSATPVAILTAIQAARSSLPAMAAGHDIPIRSATSIDFDMFSSAPETLYSRELDLRKAVPIITDVDAEIVKYFAKHPEELYNITPRTFEKLVAHILGDFGYDVELTKATRDGGTDIIAYIRTALTSFLVRIECKKYAPEHKVGIDIVRSVLGVQELMGASKSIIVTTSYFTKDATKTARQMAHRLELKDYTDLKAWLAHYT
jgi:orotate phosphoribosyltransferase